MKLSNVSKEPKRTNARAITNDNCSMIRNAMAASSSSKSRLGSSNDRNDRSSLTAAQALPLSMIWRGQRHHRAAAAADHTHRHQSSNSSRTGSHSSSSKNRGLIRTLLILITIVGSGIMFLYGSLLRATTTNAQEDVERQLNEWHLRQLSIVRDGDEIHTLPQHQRSPQSPSLSKPPLDVSLFSRPPLKPTLPTQFEHTAKVSDPNQSPYICRLYQPKGKENTTTNSATHQWAFARMVVFQKNGGKQLVTWVTHYSHVLPPDALVLIDHASTDPWTLSLLHEYAMLGMHVWHCPSGSYEYGRPNMWSTIARVYQHDSAFIFPLDVDELVTVHDNADSIENGNTMTSDPKRSRRLVWDTHSFYHALNGLGTSGKPFKMEHADVAPGDCHLPLDTIQTKPAPFAQRPPPPLRALFPSPVCAVTYAIHATPIWDVCMNKCFCRGPDFVQTDLGNHFLATNWTVSKVPTLHFSDYNVVHLCEQDGVNQWFEPSSLVLLHLQRLEFADWFLHYLRGASMHGFTNFNASTPISDCPNAARHYCEQWIEFERYDFNVDALRPVYQARFCPSADALASPEVWPIANVFDHGCGR
jgi:hypothetical protein